MFDFTTFPTLTTPRLILRELVSSDAADLFAIHGDPEVQQYDSDPPMQAIGEAFAAIERAEQRFGCRQGISWGSISKRSTRWSAGWAFIFMIRLTTRWTWATRWLALTGGVGS